jgi:hypothetical protein
VKNRDARVGLDFLVCRCADGLVSREVSEGEKAKNEGRKGE